MNKADIAAESFSKGCSCTQAVVGAFAPELGITPEMAMKVGAGFGGGLGRQAHVCGAVSGAIIAIGLKTGTADANDHARKEATYACVRDFCYRFEQTHGSIQCRVLLDCDISTKDGLALAREKKLFSTLCPAYVRSAVSLLEDILRT